MTVSWARETFTSSAASSFSEVNAAGAVPFIARLAGLPATVALAFRSERCRGELETIRHLSLELASLRTEATNKLFAALPEVPAEMRRSLLAVKRDCFNGREIRHRASASLELLRPWVGDVVARVVRHEERLTELEGLFEETYAEARDEVRELLLHLGEQRELRRGLTLASRDLVENHRRLAEKSYRQYGRKERGAEQSLARYVIRSAVKLSPYSTLTKLGMGSAIPQQGRCLRLLSRPWTERSLVRLKSYLPDQWGALLFRVPQIRDGLCVDLNDSLVPLEDGRYRFLRPWGLQRSGTKKDLEFVKPSVVKVRLGGALFEWLLARLSGDPVCYEDLCAQGAVDLGANQEEVSHAMERLLDIGALKLLPPWPSYEAYPELRILEFLETSSLARSVTLDPVRQRLRRLVEAERSYATSDEHPALIRHIEVLASEVFDELKELLAPGSGLVMEKGRQDIYEDVLMHASPAADRAYGEVLQMSRALAGELIEAGDVLWRLRGLYERRHECLHAFWHVARERWPVGTKVPCLEFFGALEDTWKLYVDHLVHGGDTLFNPYGLDAVRRLGALRTSVVFEIVQSLEARGDGYHLPVERLRRILARIPVAYRSPIGPCLIVQPTDLKGEQWVAHQIGDGSGRLSSRFNALMHDPLRDRFTSHFTERSLLTVEGEPAELLDLLFTQLTTVNRHWPQTYKVLETPGEVTHLPVDRRVRPVDLFIEIGSESGELRMRGRDGRRLVPCFLSALHAAWIPTFIKFLMVFGVDTRGRLDIPAPVEAMGQIERRPRLSLGRLVFRRERWIVPINQIPRSGGSEAATFAAVWNWRRSVGLPDNVFWIQPMRPRVEGQRLYKPQFIDFNSPTLIALFLAGLDGTVDAENITLEEALPIPEAFPRDDSGEGRGCELTLEGIVFQNQAVVREPPSMPHEGEVSPEGNLYNLEGVSK